MLESEHHPGNLAKSESMKQVSSKLIKGNIRSWFRHDCSSCYRVNDCMTASGLTQDKLEYVLRARGFKFPLTEAMLRGRKEHEMFLAQFPTIDDYGIHELIRDLLKGKKLELSEVRVCSRLYGLRGSIDKLTIQFDGRNLDADILELKTKYNKRYIYQLGAYGMILSDPHFEIIYDRLMKKNPNKYKVVGITPLPEVPINVNIRLKLQTIEDNKAYSWVWMHNGAMTSWADGVSKMIQKRMKEYRKLHKYGILLVEELSKEKPKDRQRFLGKRKPMRKTKPVVKKTC
jgi:hypothetical protein